MPKDIDTIVKEVKELAEEVYKILGAGYEENVYEEAVAVEFRKRKINYEIERNTEIMYKGERVGVHRLDFVVENSLVVELKALAGIQKSHIAQTKAYLKTLGLKKALVINFPYPEPEMLMPQIEEVNA